MKLSYLAFALGLGLSAASAHAEPVNVNLSGGNPGGLWSLLGAGMDRAVKAANPDSVITYQATGGGFANIGLLGANRTDLGLAHDAELAIALEGGEPFRAPINNMAAIGYMYNWAPMHFFLSKAIADQYNIRTLADIATSGAPIRIGVNRSGNITSNVALAMLEHAGVTEDSIRANGGSIVQAGANDQADLLRDGRIDMVTNGVFVLHSSFRAIDENNDVILVEIPEDVIEKTNAQFGLQTMVIPGGSYRNQPNDVPTPSLGALVVATESMDEAVAYELTKSFVENIEEIKAVHGSMSALTPELMVNQAILPFHPGAERAYREMGLIQ